MFRKISFMSMLVAVLLSWGAMLNFAYSEDRTLAMAELPDTALNNAGNEAGTDAPTLPETREIAALAPVSSRPPLPVKKAPARAINTGTAYYP